MTANLSSKTTNLIKSLTAIFPIALFLILKLTNLTFHFGDGNAYFYMAQAVLDGLTPYKDFLLADPPLLVYLLAAVKIIIGQNLILFMALPALLEAVSATLLYLNLKKRELNFAWLAPAFYLFSFLILSTADYVTGLHFVLLLLNLAFYFEKKPVISGICWGLAILIKLYTIPGLLVWLASITISNKPKKWQHLFKFLLALGLTGLVVMLPFLLKSPQEVINYLFIHQFNRPTGINKARIFSFFIRKDFLLIFTSLAGLFLTRSWKLLTLILSWIGFYLIFKDLYYLYLGVLAPCLTTGLIIALNKIKQTWQYDQLGQKLAVSLIILLSFSQIPSFISYWQQFRLEGRFTQIKKVADYVSQLEPNLPLYGSHEVAPLIALQTNKKLFANQMDTNAQLFASNALDKKAISQQAANDGIYLLTKIANIKANQNINLGYEGYFDQEIFEADCTRLKIFNGQDYELFDDIALYRCLKP